MLSLLRYSLRQLLKSPGFTITAIAILGFSIGLTAAIFSLIDAVILRPLPVPNSERLVQIDEPHHYHPHSVVDYPDYVDMVAAQHTFEALGLKREITLDLQTETGAQLCEADFASPSLFRVTGLPVILGRLFTEKEDIPNGPQVAVLSERCWRSRFQADPKILGRNIVLNDLSFQVIGVVPSQLDDWGPPGVDVYLPLHSMVPFNFFGEDPFPLRMDHLFTFFGRLKPGVNLSEAETDLKTIHDNLVSHYPGVNSGYGLQIFPLLGFIVEGYSTTVWLLAAAVGVLLVVSCLNIANLLFARGLHRRREIAIRATLGASRRRVIGQLLFETTLLTSIGGLVGLIVANVCVQGTKSLIPGNLYRLHELHVDTSALIFIFVLILFTSLVAGLLPALSLSHVTLTPSLNDEGGRSGTGGPRRHRTQSGLVTVQVALTCVLLIAAGLLIRSFYTTQTAELGFNPNHLLVAGIDLTGVKYEKEGAKVRAFWDELITRIRRVPGVTEAGLDSSPPLSGRWGYHLFTVDGQPEPEPDQEPALDLQTVSSDALRTMGIPILQGRDFDSQDTTDSAKVVLVDTELVKHFFPGEDPIGKTISIGGSGGNYRATDHPRYRIIGVVPYVCHDTPGGSQDPYQMYQGGRFQAYRPLAQADLMDVYLIIRSNLAATTLAAAIRQTVASIDPGVPIFDVRPYAQMIAERFVVRKLSMLLVILFSSAALFLSAVGLYGVLSYFVGQKTREIGIRMALGAQARNIVKLVAEQGFRPVGVGLTIGALAGLLLARFINSFLYGVSPYDPITLLLTIIVLGFAAVVACLLPAAKAIRIKPAKVLNE
jgi:putative ABC transport system permease protein